MPKYTPQLLGRGNNPIQYMELIDSVGGEGWLIRERVIFPVLFQLMHETLKDSQAPIMDYGAGTGSLTERLTRELGEGVEGVDVSTTFVRLAQATYPHIPFHMLKGVPGYSMYNANAHLVLHCTPEPEKVLEAMADSVEPNGHAFVTVPHADYFKAAVRRAHPNKKQYVVTVGGKAKMTYYPLSISAYETLFEQAGFVITAKRYCQAPADSPAILEKYKRQPRFVVYALQKKEDIVDTALIMHADTGKVLLLTRSLQDDKFPGAKSLFSVRRASGQDGPGNLARGIQARLGVRPNHIGTHPLGSLRVRHRHQTRLQYANVHLYPVRVQGSLDIIQNEYYAGSQLVTPASIRPFGGACTQLAYEFFRSRK
jgi:trans-aconitate methyltransferase